jgi:predicted transcriptional regulator
MEALTLTLSPRERELTASVAQSNSLSLWERAGVRVRVNAPRERMSFSDD